MTAKVIGSRESPELDIRGNLVTMVVYEYTIDNMGPFTVKLPRADDTLENVQAEVNRKMALLKGLQGA